MSKKHILLIGVGGTGSHAVDLLYQKINRMGALTGNVVKAIVLDTDAADEGKRSGGVIKLSMTDSRRLGSVVDALGRDSVDEWFPIEPASRFWGDRMDNGAAQWRKKSYLAFTNLLNNSTKKNELDQALSSLIDREHDDTTYEIYTVSSIAGGTGSGSFIPITLYAKKYIKQQLGKDVMAFAMVACPEIYFADMNDEGKKTKILANAYAILRELNAMNLVSLGYNNADPNAPTHHAPVRMELTLPANLGGKLFDSMDPKFHGAGSAPFDKVYLLDRIPGVNDVDTHDNILANSLYTLLCTGVGTEFESEDSNNLSERDRVVNMNAIYAGVATSELCYPYDSIVDYCASRQVRETCASEWLKLHRATEEMIAEAQRIAQEQRQPYTENPGDYAERFLIAYNNELESGTSELEDILREGVKDGKTDRIGDYVKLLLNTLRGALAPSKGVLGGDEESNNHAELLKNLLNEHEKNPVVNPGLFGNKDAAKQSVMERAAEYYEHLNGLYRTGIEQIRNKTGSLADQILPADFGKLNMAHLSDISVVFGLLQKNGQFIHPVAAMVVLCQLRKVLKDMKLAATKPLSDLTARDRDGVRIPYDYFVRSTGEGKCYYSSLGDDRFSSFVSGDMEAAYRKEKTNAALDASLLLEDARNSLENLEKVLTAQMNRAVLCLVEERLERLIKQYRTFFFGFEKAQTILDARVGKALRANSKSRGDRVFILSSEEDKMRAYTEYMRQGGMPGRDELLSFYDMSGKSVFETAHDALCAETASAQGVESKSKQNNSIEALFERLIKAYKERLAGTTYFKNQGDKSIFEVIADAQGRDASVDDIFKAIGSYVRVAITKAEPALQINNYDADGETAKPYYVQVVMFGKKTVDYIRQNADMFGLDPDGENRMLISQFLRSIGVTQTRFVVAEDGKDNMLYVTRKIENVQPVHIGKICESSAEPTYFTHYNQCVAMSVKDETDTLNPHLGFGWHKRGNLPFIDPVFEEGENKKMAKALLYAIVTGRLVYGRIRRSQHSEFGFEYIDDGTSRRIMQNGNPVNDKNISGLITWLRMQDARIEEWSAAYDAMVADELSRLVRYESASNLQMVSNSITRSSLITLLRENLFAGAARTKSSDYDDAEGSVSKEESRIAWNLLEFAYAVKSSEENNVDCDDAEKILIVGFETLNAYCRKVVGVGNQQAWYEVYRHQLEKFAEGVLTSDRTVREGDPTMRFRMIFEWANKNSCFCDYNEVDENKYAPIKFDLTDELRSSLAKAKAKAQAEKKAYYAAKNAAETPAETPAGAPTETPAE